MMNCEQCLNELEDFLYGELNDARALALRNHLRGCTSCAAAQTALEREQEVFAQYYEQAAPEPSDALWRAIQMRIQDEGREPLHAVVTEPQPSWWQRLWSGSGWWQQAAFATALVLVSVTATTVYFKWQQAQSANGGQTLATNATPSPTATIATTASPERRPELVTAPQVVASQMAKPTERNAVAQPSPKPLKLSEEQVIQNQLARAEREYQQAIKLLDRVIARKRDQLEPALWQQYQSSLALIDSSIAESRRALRGEATDAAAGQFLLSAYARKLDLMRDIAMQAGQ